MGTISNNNPCEVPETREKIITAERIRSERKKNEHVKSMKRKNIEALTFAMSALFSGGHAFLLTSSSRGRLIPTTRRGSSDAQDDDGEKERVPYFLRNDFSEEEEKGEEWIEPSLKAPELFVDNVLYQASELAREARNIKWEQVKSNVDALAARGEIQTFKETTVREFQVVCRPVNLRWFNWKIVFSLIVIYSTSVLINKQRQAKLVGGALEALGDSMKKQSLKKQQKFIDAADMLLESAAASSANAAEYDEEIREILKVAEEAAALTGTKESDNENPTQGDKDGDVSEEENGDDDE